MMNGEAVTRQINSWQRLGVILAIIGIGLSVVSFGGGAKAFFHGYLYGYMFWVGLTLGCFGLTLLHNAVRGNWGKPVIRIFEAGGGPVALAAMFVLFLPILLGAQELYPWADPKLVAGNEVLRHRAGYMNLPWVFIRTALFFGVWIGLASLLRRWSLEQDRTGDPNYAQMRSNFGAGGIVFFILSISFAFTDWVMSLDIYWFSTIYGLWFMVGQALLATAVTTLVLGQLSKYSPYVGVIDRVGNPHEFTVWRDLGNLMLTTTMLWGYTSLSQFLIQWSADLPEEVIYYYVRNQGWMLFLGAFLVIGEFFIPFLVLLSGKTKRNPGWRMTGIASWIILMRMLDVYWVVVPAYGQVTEGLLPYIGAFLGIGGIWMFVFAGQLKSAPLLPAHDAPIGGEVLSHA